MAFPFQVCKICRSCESPARRRCRTAIPPRHRPTDHPRTGDNSVLSHETIQLAEYAANLRFEDIPAEGVARAKDCIIDTAAAIIYGNTVPWSAIMVGYAQRTGPGGKSRILGADGPAVQPALAALANGTLSHAFELDNVVINPGAGVHGGATLLPPGLAMGQDVGGRGRGMVRAVVRGAGW